MNPVRTKLALIALSSLLFSMAADAAAAAAATVPNPSARFVNKSLGEFCAKRLSHSVPIPIAKLAEHVQSKAGSGELEKEYKAVPDGQLFVSDEGSKPENIPRNRYGAQYIAYDHSRVPLGPQCDEDQGHYINANYMHGVGLPNRYIATQGPLPNTVKDFWKMVWDNNALQIVMLTKILDHGKMKSEKYWPEDVKRYGSIEVQLEKVDYLTDFVIRNFLVKQHGEVRRVIHYHYVAWPDEGVPEYPESILNLANTVRNSPLFDPKRRPIVVHCAGGMGRTGTYILIDSLLDQAKNERHVDPARQLCAMRQRRINVVETGPQYVFAHKVVLAAVKDFTPN